ncbi:MAG TPA: hypothetical protein VMT69_04120 [Kineosporiaceae bacterium]|nr:hypothetical protein [Kineosporiaceae bacterium]
MTKKRLWVIAGVLGASSVAVLPAITAQAYPPGNHLQVTVTPTGQPHTYVVSAINGQPGCTFRVVSGNVAVNTPVGGDGKATVTVDIGAKTGTRVILAKTISCKNKETTRTKVVTTTNTLRGDTPAKVGEKITAKALGWDPGKPVTITITDDHGHVVRTTTKTPNSSGNVFWKFKAPGPAGTYAVVATQTGAPTQTYNLVVTPKKKH